MVEQVVFGTENRVLQLEPQAPHRRADSVVSAQPEPVPVQVGKQEPELTEVSVPQAGMALQQEQTTKQRPVTALTAQSAVVATTAADGRAEVETVRPEQRETSKIQQSEKISSPNVSAAVTAGEKQTGSDQQDMPERGMNENFQAHLFHQQAKTESSSTVNAASGAVQNDLSRATPAPEQVAQQVRDRFNAHETKQGSEQIVLRLSPDHLGELKVNLNLDGQRLKVEIVAENRMVRESLMQHTDALKESLSRQNIKMESFDVTTGGNNSTDSGRSQGEWRELAQRRQHNAWMPEGGYRLAKQATPAIVAYQRTSEHAMVDLHY
jgi:flagellar hook-length control protein FliK